MNSSRTTVFESSSPLPESGSTHVVPTPPKPTQNGSSSPREPAVVAPMTPTSKFVWIQRFVDMISSEPVPSDEPLQIQISMKIDGIEAQLTIRKHGHACPETEDDVTPIPYEYCITTRTPLRTAGDSMYCLTVDQLVTELKEWAGAKYVGRLRNVCAYASFMKRSDARRYDVTRRAMYAITYMAEPKVLTECYVCYEDTFGHKTLCGHDICPKCYHRSLEELDINEEADEYEVEIQEDMMYCPRVKFVCGICRTKEKSYM